MKKSKVIALSVAGAMLLSVAGAASYRTFTATERADFTIVMDGQVQKMKDGNGNVINPVVINGSTYLPLKATANLFEKSVQWDGATSTITIGEKVAVERSLLDVMKQIGTHGNFVKGNTTLTFDIGDVGVTYDTAIKVPHRLQPFVGALNEEYSELSVDLLSLDNDTTFTIFDNDTGFVILEKDVKKGEIYEVKGIDIKNVRNLKFKVSEVGENYFLNPTVK